jgi:hypothetical protein
MAPRCLTIALLAAVSISTAEAQAPARALAVVAESPAMFSDSVRVWQLPTGRLLVNDVKQGQVFMLDSALRRSSFPPETGLRGGFYSGIGPHLVPYGPDSAVVLDAGSTSVLVIAPSGVLSRSISVAGRSEFREMMNPWLAGPAPAMSTIFGTVFGVSHRMPDNAAATAVVAMNMQTARLETLAILNHNQDTSRAATKPGPGSWLGLDPISLQGAYFAQNRLATPDHWAITTDGSLVILRGRDHRLDWMGADRKIVPGAPVSFAWARRLDSERKRLADEITESRAVGYRASLARWLSDSSKGLAGPRPVRPDSVGAQDVPEIRPVVKGASAFIPDCDNNVWLRPNGLAGTDTMSYEIVSQQGGVTARVTLPPARRIVGCGRGGAMYLLRLEGRTGTIERVYVR